MSLGLNKTKRRISSIKSTQKITKAMEMVATVKLKRFRDSFDCASDYADGLEKALAKIFAYDNSESASHYAKENEEAEGSLYLVITSNLGLCAGYNANLFKYVEEHIDREKDILIPLGEKGRNHFSRDDSFKHVDLDFPAIDLDLDPKRINAFCLRLKNLFNERKVRKIVLIYTKYVNSISFLPAEYQLLPVKLEHIPEKDEEYCPPLFTPTPRELIHLLLPQYLGGIFYEKLCESQLSEQASRRTAMDNANDNADELLNKLTIEYNKARQTAITQEIVEVVSGSANA